MTDTIKVIDSDLSLTEEDVLLLCGSDLLLKMMKNRLLVIKDDPQTNIDWVSFCEGLSGFYHIKAIERARVYQVWFENPIDKDRFQKNIMISKLS